MRMNWLDPGLPGRLPGWDEDGGVVYGRVSRRTKKRGGSACRKGWIVGWDESL